MGQESMTDMTIIGAGPVGLFTAFYGGLRNSSIKIIDSLPEVGGQLSALYPEKYIYDVAGFPKIKAQDLVDQLHEQAKHFSPEICLNETVEDVKKREDGTFELTTPEGVHKTRTVIITAGAGAFQPRKLKTEEAEKYENHCLHYSVQDLKHFHNRRVLICGGGDSAIDWALALEPIAKQVTLIHRRDKFRAHEHSLSLLQQSNVRIKTPYEVGTILGEGHQMAQILIQEVRGEQTALIDVDELIVSFGFVTSLGPLKSWGLHIEKNAISVNSRMETNIPGIYAAGDICTYDGKVKLIATGFGEAPIAVNHAKNYIDPDAKLFAGHSTNLFAAPSV